MKKKKIIKRHNKKFSFFMILIPALTIILILSIVFVYNTYFNKNKSESKITNESVKNLIINLPYGWTDDFNSGLYTDKLVTYNELDKKAIFTMAVTNIPSNELYESISYKETSISQKELKNVFNSDYELIEYSSYAVSFDTLYKYIKDKYNHEGYSILEIEGLVKKGDYYTLNIPGGMIFIYKNYIFVYYGMGAYGLYNETLNYTYKVENNKLIIFQKMIIYDYTATIYEDYTNCYTNQSNIKPVLKIDNSKITVKDYDEIQNYVIEKCSPYALTYKHTFKKNSSGNYYWYSTEPYNK